MPPKRKVAKESQEQECSNKKVKATQTGVKRKVSEMSLEEKSELKRRQPSQFCCEEECFKKASFGEINQRKTHCGKHKSASMKGNPTKITPNLSTLSFEEKCEWKKREPSHFCQELNCFKRPSFNEVGKPKTHCKRHKTVLMKGVPKKQRKKISELTLEEKTCLKKRVPSNFCEEKSCLNSRIFGFIGQKRTRCRVHKQSGMTPYKQCKLVTLEQKIEKKKFAPSQFCIVEGCFGKRTHGQNGKLTFCTKHKHNLSGTVRLVIAKCKVLNCKKDRYYGYEKEKPLVCKKHQEENMFLCTQRCKFGNCKKTRLFGFVGAKKEYCKSHKEKGMILLSVPICIYPGCETSATFGSNKKKIYCAKHGKELNLTNLCKKKCENEQCEVTAMYGFCGEKKRFCYNHQLVGMTSLFSSKCKFEGCKTTTRLFGNHITGRAFCAKHHDKKIHWKLTTCKHVKCRDIATHSESGCFPFSLCHEHAPAQYNSVHETICVDCGILLLCDEDGKCFLTCTKKHAERQKRTENALNAFLEKKNMDFLRDVSPSTDCTLQRPDFTFRTPYGVIVIENDENQHRHLTEETETRRMICLHQAFGEPVHFIRFNPDSFFTNNGVKQYMDLSDRHKVLFSVLRQILETPQEFFSTHPFLSTQKLYFNGFIDIESVVVRDVVY
jgi:hypothetical protein